MTTFKKGDIVVQHTTASLSATKTEEKEQKNRDKLQKTDMQTY